MWWMLLWCVKGRFECSEEFAADVVLEAAADFTFGFSFDADGGVQGLRLVATVGREALKVILHQESGKCSVC